MNSLWVSLWVFGGLLAAILFLAAFGVFRQKEGFQTLQPSSNVSKGPSSSNPALFGIVRCPVGFTPFHSPAGDSLCCKGSINPYTHQCSSSALDALCSMTPKVKDPRNPKRTLPLCSTLMKTTLDIASLQSCPSSLPNYALESDDAAKCCKNPVVIKGQGFGCSTEDLRDKTNYCIVKGPIQTGEQRCDALAAFDDAACPKDSSNRELFQKVSYQLGEREADYYKIPDLKNVSIPVCFRLNESCIPTSALTYAQTRGAYGEYSPATWEYACENWEKRNIKRELANNTVRGYMKSLGPTSA